MKYESIVIVILTYKRNKLLLNLIELINSLSLNFSIDLYIYDNFSNNDLDLSTYIFNNLKINYVKREKNLGPVLNYFESLYEVSKKNSSKYISIIPDDDLITYEYLNKLNNLEKSDDLFDYVLFNNLILFNEEKNKFKIRKYNIDYLEILDKHTTITGTTYSTRYLRSFFNLNSIKNINLDNFMYPMTFTFLFSKNYIVQNEPCLIHRIENEMDWGDYNHYDKFYLNRLLMYQISFDNKFINHKEYYLLSKRLIVRNSFEYYLRLYNSKNFTFRKKLPMYFISLIKKRIYLKLVNLFKTISKIC